jgi:hypothetical protein
MNWSVAIFSSREDPQTLFATVTAAVTAASRRPEVATVIDVVVNGNRALAEDLASRVKSLDDKRVRIWHIKLGDKAHAWNDYVHRIWMPSDLTFFLDGYALIYPDALTLIADALAAAPHALAGSGAATTGRSAASMKSIVLRDGALYGNLFAFRRDVMNALRARGFRLPLGIYRNDGLLGAIVNFNMDPGAHDWDPSRVFIEWRATWTNRQLQIWRLGDLLTYYRRRVRQAQGVLETLAIKQHLAINRSPPEQLPRTAAELVTNWISSFPSEARRAFLKNPLCLVALSRLAAPRDWSSSLDLPVLVDSPVRAPESRVSAPSD